MSTPDRSNLGLSKILSKINCCLDNKKSIQIKCLLVHFLRLALSKVKIFFANYGAAVIIFFAGGVFITNCTAPAETTPSDKGTPPPINNIPSPLELRDIDLIPSPSSGNTPSPYASAAAMIEGSKIVISGITNRLGTASTETLTISIADKDNSPPVYTVTPSSFEIPAATLNPEGTHAVTNTVAGAVFELKPTGSEEVIMYTVELRFVELVSDPMMPISVSIARGDIALASANHHAYEGAAVVSVSDDVIVISGVKNKEEGFSEALTLTIRDATAPAEWVVTGGGDQVVLPGPALNPDGVASTTIENNEDLSFTITPTAPGGTPVKYYVHVQLGDLIQLRLLGGDRGDLKTELLLSEGTPSTVVNTVLLKDDCSTASTVSLSFQHEILVAGSVVAPTADYTLVVDPVSSRVTNPYIPSSPIDINVALRQGGSDMDTFSLQTQAVQACTAAGLSGTGVETDPYIIDNDRKLNLMVDLMTNDDASYKSAHYRMTGSLSLANPQAPWVEMGTGQGFRSIGNEGANAFAGTFDCQNNEITTLYINRSTSKNIGLFGVISGATIMNCRLINVEVTGSNHVGGLVGSSSNSSTISGSYVTGAVTGETNVGSLVGENSDSTISNSYATSTVKGSQVIGGLVGLNTGSSAVITTSYARGEVTKDAPSSGRIDIVVAGGLVGANFSSATISNSYATGNVTGRTQIGGLVGLNNRSTITTSYATGQVIEGVTGGSGTFGGLVGMNVNGTVTTSYWDTQTTMRGMAGSGGDSATGGRTTTVMTGATGPGATATDVYFNWLTSVWDFSGSSYPILRSVVCSARQTNPAAACPP